MSKPNFFKKSFAFLSILCLCAGTVFAQTQQQLPAIVKTGSHYQLLVNGRPFFILGGQCHNSSAWPAFLPKVWAAIETMHANTLEAPIYWDQLEAAPGKFDFSLVDTLLKQARIHHVHLVLLWFGTWKNGSNHYMPDWMKLDPAKYPNITGKKGQPVDSPSPHSPYTLHADIGAFTALMQHLKNSDRQRTVIMVQVENEPGSWGSIRDYAPDAQRLFEGDVPKALLNPDVLKALGRPAVNSGTWQQVFGDRAAEYFQAWSIAGYIGKVAAAGKKAYPLPLYVNVALRNPFTNPSADNYESGGATDNVIPIWKAAAPAIDLLAPDVYLEGSKNILKVLDLYHRADNPLLVPEFALKPESARYLFAVAARGGLGFAPFGIDDNGRGETTAERLERLNEFANEYAVLASMDEQLALWASEGKVSAVCEDETHGQQSISLGAWDMLISFGKGSANAMKPDSIPLGKALVVKLSENEFLAAGELCHITFRPAGNHAAKAWQYLKVQEGVYVNGEFKVRRELNGDETDWGGPYFGERPVLLRITLTTR